MFCGKTETTRRDAYAQQQYLAEKDEHYYKAPQIAASGTPDAVFWPNQQLLQLACVPFSCCSLHKALSLHSPALLCAALLSCLRVLVGIRDVFVRFRETTLTESLPFSSQNPLAPSRVLF